MKRPGRHLAASQHMLTKPEQMVSQFISHIVHGRTDRRPHSAEATHLSAVSIIQAQRLHASDRFNRPLWQRLPLADPGQVIAPRRSAGFTPRQTGLPGGRGQYAQQPTSL